MAQVEDQGEFTEFAARLTALRHHAEALERKIRQKRKRNAVTVAVGNPKTIAPEKAYALDQYLRSGFGSYRRGRRKMQKSKRRKSKRRKSKRRKSKRRKTKRRKRKYSRRTRRRR